MKEERTVEYQKTLEPMVKRLEEQKLELEFELNVWDREIVRMKRYNDTDSEEFVLNSIRKIKSKLETVNINLLWYRDGID